MFMQTISDLAALCAFALGTACIVLAFWQLFRLRDPDMELREPPYDREMQ